MTEFASLDVWWAALLAAMSCWGWHNASGIGVFLVRLVAFLAVASVLVPVLAIVAILLLLGIGYGCGVALMLLLSALTGGWAEFIVLEDDGDAEDAG